jgi:isocitrate dehydrogenase kinase/phosphatase
MKTPKPELIDIKAGKRSSDALPRKASSPMAERVSLRIAETILDGFNRHYQIFMEITQAARQRFEHADWQEQNKAASQRILLYPERVEETTRKLRAEFNLESVEEHLWKEVKLGYLGLLYDHKQPELAETFYNSVFTWLFDRRYYSNDNIFVRPGLSTEYLEGAIPTYHSFYPTHDGLKDSVEEILRCFKFDIPFENLERDVKRLVECIKLRSLTTIEFRQHFQLQVLSTPFYRNKGAYIVGRAINGPDTIPFVIPLLNNECGGIYVDALLTDTDDIANLFSFARAYFMVETEVPATAVQFLLRTLPTKTKADLYTSIGLQKQGKSEFYRDFLHHLKHSSDKLIIAPGIKGMVMSVFTLPSYPFVFKVINDHFDPPKDIDRKTVVKKYQLVKMHDRVGRMADTLEYSYAAFPIERFSDELIEYLKQKVAGTLSFEDDQVIFRHIYIERRLEPLNILINRGDKAEIQAAITEYGHAIKELAAANIFPGDLLYKNFGVTRHGRVIFYDYDEIELMTDCHFRTIPAPRTLQDEMASEPWYSIGEHDIFPEEFAGFLLTNPHVREAFMREHADLLEAEYWQSVQSDINAGRYQDIFPYSEAKRFCHIFERGEANGL